MKTYRNSDFYFALIGNIVLRGRHRWVWLHYPRCEAMKDFGNQKGAFTAQDLCPTSMAMAPLFKRQGAAPLVPGAKIFARNDCKSIGVKDWQGRNAKSVRDEISNQPGQCRLPTRGGD